MARVKGHFVSFPAPGTEAGQGLALNAGEELVFRSWSFGEDKSSNDSDLAPRPHRLQAPVMHNTHQHHGYCDKAERDNNWQ